MPASPLDWSRIGLLILDLDNTLCDTFHTLSKPQWARVERRLEERGWGQYAQALRKGFGKKGFKHVLEDSGMTPAQVRFAIREYDKVDVTPLRLFPDAHAILDLDIPKVLLSRGEAALQRRKLRHLGVAKMFDEIVIVDTFATKDKAIKDILKRHKAAPSQALIVGDRIGEEIADGKRLGIPTALVRRPGWKAGERVVEPDVTVRSLETVARKLQNKKF